MPSHCYSQPPSSIIVYSNPCSSKKKHCEPDPQKSCKTSGVVYVDAQYGDDNTGSVEDACKPFSTINGAISAAQSASTSSNTTPSGVDTDSQWTIYIFRGEYPEGDIQCYPNIDLLGHDDNVFVSGRLLSPSSGTTKVNFLNVYNENMEAIRVSSGSLMVRSCNFTCPYSSATDNAACVRLLSGNFESGESNYILNDTTPKSCSRPRVRTCISVENSDTAVNCNVSFNSFSMNTSQDTSSYCVYSTHDSPDNLVISRANVVNFALSASSRTEAAVMRVGTKNCSCRCCCSCCCSYRTGAGKYFSSYDQIGLEISGSTEISNFTLFEGNGARSASKKHCSTMPSDAPIAINTEHIAFSLGNNSGALNRNNIFTGLSHGENTQVKTAYAGNSFGFDAISGRRGATPQDTGILTYNVSNDAAGMHSTGGLSLSSVHIDFGARQSDTKQLDSSNYFVTVDTGADNTSTKTIQLPPITNTGNNDTSHGQIFVIKRVDCNSNTLEIVPDKSSTTTIENKPSICLTGEYDWVGLQYHASSQNTKDTSKEEWYIVSRRTSSSVTCYVDALFGKDSTALYNDPQSPWKTLHAALNSLGNACKTLGCEGIDYSIVVRPGSYTASSSSNNNLAIVDNVAWHFEAGSCICGYVFDTTQHCIKNLSVTGYGEFKGNSPVLKVSSSSDVYFSAKRVTGSISSSGTLDLHVGEDLSSSDSTTLSLEGGITTATVAHLNNSESSGTALSISGSGSEHTIEVQRLTSSNRAVSCSDGSCSLSCNFCSCSTMLNVQGGDLKISGNNWRVTNALGSGSGGTLDLALSKLSDFGEGLTWSSSGVLAVSVDRVVGTRNAKNVQPMFSLQGSGEANLRIGALYGAGKFYGFEVQRDRTEIDMRSARMDLDLVHIKNCSNVFCNIGEVYRQSNNNGKIFDIESSSASIQCSKLQLDFAGSADVNALYCSNDSNVCLDFGKALMGKDKDSLIASDAFVFSESVFSLTLQELIVDGNGVYLESSKEEYSFLDFGQILYNASVANEEKAIIHCRGRMSVTGKKARVNTPEASVQREKVAVFNHDAKGDYSAQVYIDTVLMEKGSKGTLNCVHQRQPGHLIFWSRVFYVKGDDCNCFRLDSNQNSPRPLIGGFIAVEDGNCVVTSGDFEIFGSSSLFVGKNSVTDVIIQSIGSGTPHVAFNHCCVTVNRDDSNNYLSDTSWQNPSNVLEDSNYNLPPILF